MDSKSPKTVLPRTLAKKARSKTPNNAVDKGQTLRNPNDRISFETITNLKVQGRTVEAIRMLTDEEALSGFSLYAMAQIADSGIKIKAYQSGTTIISPEATEAAKAIVASMDTLSDYSKGYSDKAMLKSVIHTLLRESPQTGGIALELVLNKNRLPDRLQVVDYNTIQWVSDGEGGRYPIQKVSGGDPVDLNIPNFFVAELHKESHEVYATPLLKSSLGSSIANNEFIEDMRRAVNKSGHSRLVVSLNAEKVRAAAPQEIQNDEKRLAAFMETQLEAVRDELSLLEPDDSVVGYDSAEFDVADIGGSKSDYVPLMKQMANLQSTGLKTPPSIIGVRADGSQSLSNSETMVYLKIVRAIQTPVEEVLSRAMTLALRIYGFDAYVRVEFQPIDLRPYGELEAFRVQQQQRCLELLSLGLISDYDFSIELGLNYNPEAPQLSGTGFHKTSNREAVPETDNTGAQERTLKSDSPKRGGGKSQ